MNNHYRSECVRALGLVADIAVQVQTEHQIDNTIVSKALIVKH